MCASKPEIFTSLEHDTYKGNLGFTAYAHAKLEETVPR